MKYSLPQAHIKLVVKEASNVTSRSPVDCKDKAVAAIKSFLKTEDRECVVALLLNVKAKPLSWYMVSEGGRGSASVDIMQIMKAAILTSASSLILFHNHPSGETNPSVEDLELTTRISKACRIMGLTFCDHIIVGLKNCFSFRESMSSCLDATDI